MDDEDECNGDDTQAVELSIVILVDNEGNCCNGDSNVSQSQCSDPGKAIECSCGRPATTSTCCAQGERPTTPCCGHANRSTTPCKQTVSTSSLPNNRNIVIGPICVDKRERSKSVGRQCSHDHSDCCGNRNEPMIVPTAFSTCPCASMRSPASQPCGQSEAICQDHKPCSTCGKPCQRTARPCSRSEAVCQTVQCKKSEASCQSAPTKCNKSEAVGQTAPCEPPPPPPRTVKSQVACQTKPCVTAQTGTRPCAPAPCRPTTRPASRPCSRPCGRPCTRPATRPCRPKSAKSATCQTQTAPPRPPCRPKTCQPKQPVAEVVAPEPKKPKVEKQVEEEVEEVEERPRKKSEERPRKRSEERPRKRSEERPRKKSVERPRKKSAEVEEPEKEEKPRRKSKERRHRKKSEERHRRKSEEKDRRKSAETESHMKAARRSITEPDKFDWAHFPTVQYSFIDYVLKTEGGTNIVLALSKTSQKYEKQCKEMLSKIGEGQRSQAKEFFLQTTREAIKVKVPDSNNTSITHYHLMKYLKPISESLQLDAQEEIHAIHKYHNYMVSVVNYMEERLQSKEIINPDALVDIDTHLLAGIMKRFLPLFLKLKDTLVRLASDRESHNNFPPEMFVKELRKLMLAMYLEVVCLDVSFKSTLTSLSYLPSVEVQEKYRNHLELRKTHARHCVAWGAGRISIVLLYYYVSKFM